jgi:hypothetical protein
MLGLQVTTPDFPGIGNNASVGIVFLVHILIAEFSLGAITLAVAAEWHHVRTGRVEVGLHFEGRPELNQRALDFFRERMVEVKGALPRAELEPWERGWARLYETLAAPELSDEVLALAADRLAAYIRTLQPILEDFWEKR